MLGFLHIKFQKAIPIVLFTVEKWCSSVTTVPAATQCLGCSLKETAVFKSDDNVFVRRNQNRLQIISRGFTWILAHWLWGKSVLDICSSSPNKFVAFAVTLLCLPARVDKASINPHSTNTLNITARKLLTRLGLFPIVLEGSSSSSNGDSDEPVILPFSMFLCTRKMTQSASKTIF